MKKFFKIIGIGVLIGIVLTVIQVNTGIERGVFLNYFLMASIIFLIGFIVFNTAYFGYYASKIAKIAPLYQEKKYDEYNKQMEELLKKAKIRQIQGVLRISLSAGYIQNNEFEKALKTLEEVDIKQLSGEKLKLVYWLNLCTVYFRLSILDKFFDTYDINKKLFEKYKNDKEYGENIFQINLIHTALEGNFEDARWLIEGKSPQDKKEYEELISLIEHMKK